MQASVTTWNINSVRLRADLVRRFLLEARPDALCLQEIKCPLELFPGEAFSSLGYEHQAVVGQKGYHGVAILSRHPFLDTFSWGFCGQNDARHVAVRFPLNSGSPLAGATLHNFYVPAGGDVPDPVVNEKFAHKLAFVDEMAARLGGPAGRTILVGDLNIAPLEHDVWSHKQMRNVVSHTPVEVDGLSRLLAAGQWIDTGRHLVPAGEKLYTWWSYRAPDWAAANKGRRLDHVWVSPDLEPALRGVGTLREARGWDRPSDHVPTTAYLDFDDLG